MTSVYSAAAWLWSWLTVPQATRDSQYDNALLAIVTVAIVMWTALFFVRTKFNPFDITSQEDLRRREAMVAEELLELGMIAAVLTSAAVGSIVALIAVPHGIRFVAIGLGAFYAFVYRGRFRDIAGQPNWSRKNVVLETALFYGGLAFAVAWPSELCIAIVSLCWVYFAGQRFYQFMYNLFVRGA